MTAYDLAGSLLLAVLPCQEGAAAPSREQQAQQAQDFRVPNVVLLRRRRRRRANKSSRQQTIHSTHEAAASLRLSPLPVDPKPQSFLLLLFIQ